MVRSLTGMLLCAGALLAVVSPVQAEDWRLVKDQAGIQVFLSKVPGSKYQAYRGVVRLKTDMPTLLALQEDVSGSCAWIYARRAGSIVGSPCRGRSGRAMQCCA